MEQNEVKKSNLEMLHMFCSIWQLPEPTLDDLQHPYPN